VTLQRIHPESAPCSDLGRVLALNDPPERRPPNSVVCTPLMAVTLQLAALKRAFWPWEWAGRGGCSPPRHRPSTRIFESHPRTWRTDDSRHVIDPQHGFEHSIISMTSDDAARPLEWDESRDSGALLAVEAAAYAGKNWRIALATGHVIGYDSSQETRVQNACG